MSLTVVPVRTRRELHQFVDFPWSLYNATDHPQWVPPLRATVHEALDQEKNPFYLDAKRELFLAMRDGKMVGRIAAIENRAHNHFAGDRVGFWGFFESVNDQHVAGVLFAAAATWLTERGLSVMRGPMNPSTNYECGLLVDGFEHRPTFMTAWNPPYYDDLCRGAGLEKAKDLLAFWFSGGSDFILPEFVERQAVRALARGRISFRDLDPRRFTEEVAALWPIYNDAWERNWGFVPMTYAEFVYTAKDMKHLCDPRMAFMAEVDGRPAGFMLALPDYNEVLVKNRGGRLLPFGALRMLWGKTRIKGVRVMALGVKKEFRSRSILALFTHEIVRRGRAMGKRGGEASWLLEDNDLIVKPMRAMGALELKKWRVYDTPLQTNALLAGSGPLRLPVG